MHRLVGCDFVLSFNSSFNISSFNKLFLNISKISFCYWNLNCIDNRFKVTYFFSNLLNKTDSGFIGSFKLVISCKIFVGILNWCESIIKRNLNCSIIVVIKCLIFLRTCRNTVSVGCKKLAVDTVFVLFLSVLYLLFLNVKLLVCSFKMCCYNSSYITDFWWIRVAISFCL